MTDPTFATSGSMTSFLIGIQTISNLAAELSYLPVSEPPPPWTAGNQWKNLTPKGYSSTSVPPNFAAACLYVTDRSSQSIPLGKSYVFNQWSTKDFKTYYIITGVEGGSTVLPGIGLINLVSNPKAWTFITPQVFEGVWEVSWLSPWSVTPETVSIIYAPAQSGFNTARLSYEYKGYYSIYPLPPDTDDEPGILIETPDQQITVMAPEDA